MGARGRFPGGLPDYPPVGLHGALTSGKVDLAAPRPAAFVGKAAYDAGYGPVGATWGGTAAWGPGLDDALFWDGAGVGVPLAAAATLPARPLSPGEQQAEAGRRESVRPRTCGRYRAARAPFDAPRAAHACVRANEETSQGGMGVFRFE